MENEIREEIEELGKKLMKVLQESESSPDIPLVAIETAYFSIMLININNYNNIELVRRNFLAIIATILPFLYPNLSVSKAIECISSAVSEIALRLENNEQLKEQRNKLKEMLGK